MGFKLAVSLCALIGTSLLLYLRLLWQDTEWRPSPQQKMYAFLSRMRHPYISRTCGSASSKKDPASNWAGNISQFNSIGEKQRCQSQANLPQFVTG